MTREVYDNVTTSDIYNEFVKMKDINNVVRVLTFEKKFLDSKIDVLKGFINKLEKNDDKKTSKTNKANINKDL